MTVRPTPARLAPPRQRPGWVARPRLLRSLDAGIARGADVVVIAGPAGSGKTVLLATWAAGRAAGGPVAWVPVDEADADPVRFWGGVLRALEDAGVAVAGASALLGADAPDQVAVALLDDIAQVGGPLTLVLDDLHAADVPAVTGSLRTFIAGLPAGVVLAIGTRADPGIGVARLRAAGRLAELRATDLAFTATEADGLLRDTLGLDGLRPEQVAALADRTEGWAAGLQLAGLSLAGHDAASVEDAIAGFAGSHRHLVDYLIDEVVGQQPAAVRDFLERTSIVEQLGSELAEALVEGADGRAMLEHLERCHLFLVPLDGVGGWYRYHALFAEGLRHLLRRRGGAEVRALHGRASAWFEANAMPEAAVEHALAGDDAVRAGRLIRGLSAALVGRGEHATLERWLGALPPEAFAATPGLRADLLALRLLAGDLDAAEAIAARHEAADRPSANASDDVRIADARILSLGGSTAVSRLDHVTGERRARAALERLPTGAEVDRAAALVVLGRSLLVGGDPESAAAVLGPALELAERSGNAFDALQAEVLLAQVAIARGAPATAEAPLRRVLGRTEGRAFIPRYEAAVTLATALRLAGRPAEAEAPLAIAADLGARVAGGVYAAVWRVEAVQVAVASGDQATLAEAVDALERATLRLGGERPQAMVAALRAGLAAGPAARSGSGAARPPAERGLLSARELEVLRLIAAGRTNGQIARELVVTLNTVKAHLHHISTKLDTPNRTATVARARELGLLP